MIGQKDSPISKQALITALQRKNLKSLTLIEPVEKGDEKLLWDRLRSQSSPKTFIIIGIER
jgi:hypothetical protein